MKSSHKITFFYVSGTDGSHTVHDDFVPRVGDRVTYAIPAHPMTSKEVSGKVADVSIRYGAIEMDGMPSKEFLVYVQ